jgi:hypothetical protein
VSVDWIAADDDDPQAVDWIAAEPAEPPLETPGAVDGPGELIEFPRGSSGRVAPGPAPLDVSRENRRTVDLEAEREVLASVLIDPPAIVDALEHVTATDFSTPEHRAIYAAMLACYERGQAPEVVTVAAELGGAVGLGYLTALKTPTSFQIGQYAALVAAAARRRRIAEASARVTEAASYGGSEDEIGRRLAELETVAARTPAARAAVSLADYLADPAPVRHAIPSLAVAESVTAVVGPPESMKTFMLLQAGLACAGSGDLLGLHPDLAPFVYVSGDKSRATVRERFRRMTAGAMPTEPVMILHRAGVTFGRGWDIVRRTLDRFGRPALVGLDTLASLSGPGFDENSGQDMALALAAMRGIVTDYGATVLIAHHPTKHSEGSGGATLRGHSSLFGEIDGVIAMRRHSRETTTGTLTAEPKDGERVVLGFEWSPETFRLRPSGIVPLTLEAIAETIAAAGGSADGEQIVAAFPGRAERTVYQRLAEAVAAGAVERTGKRRFYRYTVPNLALTEGWES